MIARYTHPNGTGGLQWRVTVLSQDGQTVLDNALLEDEECVKAHCTVWRSQNLSTKIRIKPPAGDGYEWA